MDILFYWDDSGPSFLANCSPHRIVLDEETWPTVEHYFQAMKFPDYPDIRKIIRAAPSARMAKEIAYKNSSSVSNEWLQLRLEVMRRAVTAKFQQHPEIRSLLIDTGDNIIIEDSPTCSYWGRGPDGNGENHLGKILMDVRLSLKSA